MKVGEFLQGWEEITGRAVTSTEEVWATRYCREGSALLGFTADGPDVYLILIATDPAKARVLQFVVRKAFAGDRVRPLWSDGDRLITPQQRSVLERLGVTSCSLYSLSGPRDHVKSVYRQLTKVESHRRSSEVPLHASTGALIRALRRAVERLDQPEAAALLAELRGRALSDQYQCDFLELWAQVKLDPGSVADGEALKRCLEGNAARMPRALLALTADAVLRTAVYPALRELGGAAYVQAVRSGGHTASATLFERARGLDSEEGAVCRALASIHDRQNHLKPGDLEALRSTPGAALEAELPARTSEQRSKYEIFARAEEEMATGDLSPETVQALEGFAHAGDPVAHRYLEVGLGEADAPGAESADDSAVGENGASQSAPVASGALENPPPDWLTWLARVQGGVEDPKSPGSGFSYGELPLIAEPQAAGRLEQLRGVLEEMALDETMVEAVLDVFPSILGAWGRIDLRPAESRGLSEALGRVLLYGVLISLDRLNHYGKDDLVGRFMQQGMESGLSTDAYLEVVGELAARVEEVRSPRHLEEFIDLFEFLTDQPHANGEAYQRLARAMCEKAHQFSKRLSSEFLELLAELVALVGMTGEGESLRECIPAVVDDPVDESPRVSLAGKKILIYTLMEGAAHRAKAKIEGRLGAEVRLNHDHKATATLKAGLDWADIVISVTRAAQHAATIEIDRRVPSEFLIRPGGMGSSSIWNFLIAWLARDTAGAG